MKLIIAGGRDYAFNRSDIELLNGIYNHHYITEIVSGACGLNEESSVEYAKGADGEGERWADTKGVPVKRFPVTKSDWKSTGKKAGPIRNAEMAAYADAVVLFPGGRGTDSMRQEVIKAGIMVFES